MLVRKYLGSVSGPLLGLGLVGCTSGVYRPMQCAAPALNGKGQVEATLTSYITLRGQAAVNYAPGNHWLVRAAYDRRAIRRATDSSHLRSWQYELAAGTYWPLGRQRQLVLGALAGVGQGRFQERDRNQRFNELTEYDVRCNTGFGELYAVWQADPHVQIVTAYRLTGIHYTAAAGRSTPLLLDTELQGGPMFALRVTLPHRVSQQPIAYVQLGLGASNRLRGWSAQFGRQGADEIQSFSYLTLGVGFLPAALWRRSGR